MTQALLDEEVGTKMGMDLAARLDAPRAQQALKTLYGAHEGVLLRQRERYLALERAHAALFGPKETHFFSSPGRTEIGGNHTDHNHGRVLAAAVTLDMLACVSVSGDSLITLYSKGYDKPFVVDSRDTDYRPEEEGSTQALIRGVCAQLRQRGLAVGGFNGVMVSDVLSGSGLSSSAAFEVLLAAILDGLFNGGTLDPVERAKLCQVVENRYFGKPSGLMDQSACSVGGLVGIDFEDVDAPRFEQLQYDFEAKGYSLVVVATRSSHDDLTDEYASIPKEMKQVAEAFGCQTLRQVDPALFYQHLGQLRRSLSDRALMRAMHFFGENQRVADQLQALQQDRLADFLSMVVDSGESSWRLLQNLYVGGQTAQSLALACALSEKLLKGRGAWRVHGGGFAGTILAFVPEAQLAAYVQAMDGLFGAGAATVLGIRPVGPVEVAL